MDFSCYGTNIHNLLGQSNRLFSAYEQEGLIFSYLCVDFLLNSIHNPKFTQNIMFRAGEVACAGLISLFFQGGLIIEVEISKR